MTWTRAVGLAVAIFFATNGFGTGHAAADSDVLWRIVNDQCVPHQRMTGDPAPCTLVNDDRGYALMKDIDGAAQYLLIPTERISGIESPELLAPDATNYFAAAWQARTFVEDRLGRSVPRDWLSLAINSEFARSQNQLHIHIDCLRADVHDALKTHVAEIGPTWTPLPVPLVGGPYSAIAVAGEDLGAVNPFQLLADGVPGARADMGRRTLVVVGATLSDGRPGFIILAGLVDLAAGDTGGGETTQDHRTCAAPVAGK